MSVESNQKNTFPCIIREILFAPPTPSPSIAHLLEVALIHHNSSHYQLSIQTYLKAQEEWYECELKEAEKRGEIGVNRIKNDENFAPSNTITNKQSIANASLTPISPSAYIFFRLAIGSVYESAGSDELALQHYMDAKRHAEKHLAKDHPDRALPYSCIGQIYFHLKQWELARTYFNRARELKVILLGSEHVDAACSYNNIAACLHVIGEIQESINLYHKSMIIFNQRLGLNHPRTGVVQRNITKIKSSFLNDFSLGETTFSELYLPIEKKTTKKKGKKGKKGKGKKKKK